MFQTSTELTIKQKFTLQAVCLKGFRLKRICISPYCNSKNIYLCGKSQDTCQCYYQHKYCPTINHETFCQRFHNYKTQLNKQTQEYIQRFQKVFNNLESKIKKQAKLFKSHYESLLFGDIKSSIEKKIYNKNVNNLTSFQISNFLNFLETNNKQINCGKLSLSEAHQLDKKIAQLFSFIQNLYKKKILKKQSLSKQKSMRSYSSSCLEKKTLNIQRSKVNLGKSLLFYQNHLKDQISRIQSFVSKQLFSQNLSSLLEKKTISDYFQDKDSQLKPPKINLDYPKSIPSKIIQNCLTINHFIGKKVQSYELLFRASENNFLIKDFYKQIQSTLRQKDMTDETLGYLFLIKSEFNHVFGGFTQLCLADLNKKITEVNSLKKQSQSESQLNPQQSTLRKKRKYLHDIKSLTFLFSLDLKEKYHLKDPQKALYFGSHSIGFGNSDLRIRNKSHLLRQNYCKIGDSFKLNQNSKHFDIDYETKNLKIIGSRYGKKFKIAEWQCFKVKYSKQNYS